MNTFTCGSHTYRAANIDARKQFHIVRRLAPLLGGLGPALGKMESLKKEGFKAADISASDMESVLPAITGALSGMDDDTADYVIFGLLAAIHRQEPQGLGWAPVAPSGSLMYQDITMPQMLTLAGRALVANLGDFFVVLNSLSSQLGQKPKGQ